MSIILLSVQLYETSHVSSWISGPLQLDCQSWKYECIRDAARNYSNILSCFTREHALHHGKEFLPKFVVGVVRQLGNTQVLPARFHKTKNDSDS